MSTDWHNVSNKDEQKSVAGESQQPQKQQPQAKAVDKAKNDNPYEFNDAETEAWGSYDMDTDIARAWSRASRRGFHLGKPDDSEEEGQGVFRQDFQFGWATTVRDDKENPNMTVNFYDGRGFIIGESGL